MSTKTSICTFFLLSQEGHVQLFVNQLVSGCNTLNYSSQSYDEIQMAWSLSCPSHHNSAGSLLRQRRQMLVDFACYTPSCPVNWTSCSLNGIFSTTVLLANRYLFVCFLRFASDSRLLASIWKGILAEAWGGFGPGQWQALICFCFPWKTLGPDLALKICL